MARLLLLHDRCQFRLSALLVLLLPPTHIQNAAPTHRSQRPPKSLRLDRVHPPLRWPTRLPHRSRLGRNPLSGAIRAFGSVLAVAIDATTLTNRLPTTIPANMVPAAENPSLPASSSPALISGLGGTTVLNTTTVPGLTPHIVAAASQAYRVANAEAYRTVFLASFAFGGLDMVICWFVAQNGASKANYVSSHLHAVKDEKRLNDGGFSE